MDKLRRAHKKLPWLYQKFNDLGDIDFEKHIDKCDALLARPSGPPKRSADRERLAVEAARGLLLTYRHKLTTTRGKLGGKWCRLATILYGDTRVDLYHYVCERSLPRVLRQAKGVDLMTRMDLMTRGVQSTMN